MSQTRQETDQEQESESDQTGLPFVRTTSSVKPWQMAYLSLENVNGSELFRTAIRKHFEEQSPHSAERITNALETLCENQDLGPKEAIHENSSLNDLLEHSKPEIHE